LLSISVTRFQASLRQILLELKELKQLNRKLDYRIGKIEKDVRKVSTSRGEEWEAKGQSM